MKVSREVKTAILVISSILLFVWGYSFLKGKDIFNRHKIFYAVYDDVEGLTTSAAVTINGLNIGKVTKISFLDKEGKLLVEMQVNTDFPISRTSLASIYQPGLLGGKQIAILPNHKDNNLAVSGDRLISDIKQGVLSSVVRKLDPLQTKIERTLELVDKLLENFNTIFDEQSKADLKRSVSELSQVSKVMNTIVTNNHSKIDGTIANLNIASANFLKLSDSLSKANLGRVMKDMEKTMGNVDKIMTDLQQGRGSMGKLLKDDAMYNNLEGASKELKLLLLNMRNNPKRYVHFSIFGKKETPYKETEEETMR